ncbi:MAG TPA: hypothetical protein PLD47_04370 [Aggregatilineales bacterium]|nr:hypothetical protein [Anaerolineales bacterium]HRE46937.1 hypothetical protein [Aggregatilineales bacterium]
MRTVGRGQAIWLALIGVLVLVVSLASVAGVASVPPTVALMLVLAYLAGTFVTLRGIDLSAVGQQVGQRVRDQAQTARMTGAARRASQKARARSPYTSDTAHVLADIGLLVNTRRKDSTWNRRVGESASYDDGAIQPYIKLRIEPEIAGQTALIEFEFYDRSGNLQFSHRMQEYLRDGENLILCERQLPLRDNSERGRAGLWDLRVRVNSELVGIHEFSMSTSAAERGEALPSREESRSAPHEDRGRHVLAVDEDDPVSLEDLLREQARRSQASEN